MERKWDFNTERECIVPEYYSRNPALKGLFFSRLEIARSYVFVSGAKRVLDLGCGDGLLTRMIKDDGAEDVVGVDHDIIVKQLRKKYGDITFVRQDIRQLRFGKKFDAVACLDVLEHFPDVEAVLRRIKAVIKPKGYLIVSGPVESFWYKLLRVFVKGSFFQSSGTGDATHYHNIIELDKVVQRHFRLVKKQGIYFLFFHLFDVNLYQKE